MSLVQTSFPGVYVVEELSSVHTIVGVPTSVAGFVGAAPRGPVNTPVHLTSWSDYERAFGGLDAAVQLSYAVYLYFVNGGSVAEVVRADGAVGKDPSGNEVDNRAKTAFVAVKAKGGIEFTLDAASPGAWGNDLTATVDHTNADAPTFNLTLTDPVTRRQEQYQRVSLQPMDDPRKSTLLKDALATSSLVRLRPPPKPDGGGGGGGGAGGGGAGGGGAGAGGPESFKGSGGADADPAKGPIDVAAGWRALASADIFTMLCLPTKPSETYSAETLSTAAAFCRAHRAVLIVDPPHDWPPGTTGTSVAGFADVDAKPALTGDALSYAALYYPNLVLTDQATGAPLTVGPSGAVAGVWARTDADRGVWKAPAGTAAGLTGIGDVQVRLTDAQIGTLNPLAVNCLKVVPFSGPVVWGARTTDGGDTVGSPWKYLPVRRTALFIEESLRRGTQWVVFEPNDEPLWASVRLNVGAFMNSLFRAGAFAGSTPDQAYFVKCDAENNPQNDIDRGILNLLVGFAPLKPAEFVIIHIEQMTGQLQV